MKAEGAVIVAGGASLRMGRAKEWLEIDGVPLLRWVVDRIRPVCATIVVAARPGQALPAVAGARRVDDPPDDPPGPLRGLVTGLCALSQADVEMAYLGASDNPFTNALHVQFLFDRLRQDSSLAAVVPEETLADGRRLLHPLSSAVRVTPALRAAQQLRGEGVGGAKMLFSRLTEERVSVSELPVPEVVRPCNTPQQWVDAVSTLAGAR